jgi:hypothetical protein
VLVLVVEAEVVEDVDPDEDVVVVPAVELPFVEPPVTDAVVDDSAGDTSALYRPIAVYDPAPVAGALAVEEPVAVLFDPLFAPVPF